MKIHFNKEEQCLELKDHVKGQYLMLKGIAILNLANAVIHLFNGTKNAFGVIEIIWIVLGILSCVALYYFLVKKSTRSKIFIRSIKRLSHKSFWGNSRFSLVLENGKQRDLLDIKTEKEFNAFKHRLKELGTNF